MCKVLCAQYTVQYEPNALMIAERVDVDSRQYEVLNILLQTRIVLHKRLQMKSTGNTTVRVDV